MSLKCIATTNDKLISECLEYNGFSNRNLAESIQLKYNFHYLNALHKFNGFHEQELFLISYWNAISDCKNTTGCDLKDDGKNYYISLNKCLENGRCIDQFIYDDEKDCSKNFDREIDKIPKNLQVLITVDKSKVCKIKEQSLKMIKKRGY